MSFDTGQTDTARYKWFTNRTFNANVWRIVGFSETFFKPFHIRIINTKKCLFIESTESECEKCEQTQTLSESRPYFMHTSIVSLSQNLSAIIYFMRSAAWWIFKINNNNKKNERKKSKLKYHFDNNFQMKRVRPLNHKTNKSHYYVI